MQGNSSSVYVTTTVGDNSDCLMQKECKYYAEQDSFFPVSVNKPLRFLIREVMWTFLCLKEKTIEARQRSIKGYGVATADAQIGDHLKQQETEQEKI